MGLIVLLIIVVVLGFWFVGVYNNLVSLKNQVFNAWKQIDVQLKRRHDLIPNLVETVKGAMNFERDTLEAVVQARNKAIAVQAPAAGTAPSAQQVQQTAAAESQLSGALGRLFAVVEAYPDLKSTGNVAQLQEELTSTENKIGFARQFYNDLATSYNIAQQVFPASFIASTFHFTPVELFQIPEGEAAQREVPKVDLNLGS